MGASVTLYLIPDNASLTPSTGKEIWLRRPYTFSSTPYNIIYNIDRETYYSEIDTVIVNGTKPSSTSANNSGVLFTPDKFTPFLNYTKIAAGPHFEKIIITKTTITAQNMPIISGDAYPIYIKIKNMYMKLKEGWLGTDSSTSFQDMINQLFVDIIVKIDDINNIYMKINKIPSTSVYATDDTLSSHTLYFASAGALESQYEGLVSPTTIEYIGLEEPSFD